MDPESLFDIQVKRLHEYKRQHLNVLHIVTLYNRLKRLHRRRAHAAHLHLRRQGGARLSHGQADHQADQRRRAVINHDPRVSEVLKVVFLPDFNVKNGQRVYPAADLSEQISTAGKEASGTGNMKFAMNGALTIGTLDGANIEIRDAVGPENFFLFGLTADEVARLQGEGYTPRRHLRIEPRAARGDRPDRSGFFSDGDRELFRPLVDSLLTRDDYMLLADYQAYVDCQQRVSEAYRDQQRLDAHVDPELRAGRPLLVGPVDPRVLPRHLERHADCS